MTASKGVNQIDDELIFKQKGVNQIEDIEEEE